MRFFSKILALCFIALMAQSASAEWIKQKSNTFAWLHSVYFLDQNRGWIVGSKGTYLETRDGGNTWKPQKNVTQDTIRDIYFFDENTGWALCEQDVYSGSASSPSYILKTTDGGATWGNVDLEDEGSERIARMFFSKNGRGWAVGEAGTVYEMGQGDAAWKKLNSNTKSDLLDVFFLNSAEGWAIGDSGTILYTKTAGNLWIELETSVKHKLEKVFFAGQKGWAVGFGGTILRYDPSLPNRVKPQAKPPVMQRRTSSL